MSAAVIVVVSALYFILGFLWWVVVGCVREACKGSYLTKRESARHYLMAFVWPLTSVVWLSTVGVWSVVAGLWWLLTKGAMGFGRFIGGMFYDAFGPEECEEPVHVDYDNDDDWVF